MTARKVPAQHVTVAFEPLDQPVRAHASQEASPFTASWRSTELLLRTEVGNLGADEVVLAVDAPRNAMRRDGGIRADAKVRSEGVEVFLQASVGAVRFSCARYSGRGYGSYLIGWQANVRAIALGMEALRKVERYGLGSGTEQYRGYQALPPGVIEVGAVTMSVEEAAAYIGAHAGADWSVEVGNDPCFALALFKDAAKLHHPDQGGDPAVFRLLVDARDVLQREFPDRA